MNFINEYVKTVSGYTDTPDLFIRGSAYHLVSSLWGRFFKNSAVPGVGRPNFWFLMSSIPGITRRSTIQKIDRNLHRSVLTALYKEEMSMSKNDAKNMKDEALTEGEIEEAYYSELVSASIIEEGTSEGIMDHISENTKINSFDIASPEFGAVLKGMSDKKHMHGTLNLFSKLKYGEGGSVYLSQRGKAKGARILREGLYVTMFAGMQEPKHYIEPMMIRQGLLRRILICFVKPEELKIYKKYIDRDRPDILKEIQKYGDYLTKKTFELKEKSKYLYKNMIDVQISRDVELKINDFCETLWRDVVADPSDVNVFRQSQAEQLTDLCTLEAIANESVTNIAGEPILNVKNEHYDKAKEFFDRAVENSKQMILSLYEKTEPVRTYKFTKDTLVECVRTSEDGIILQMKMLDKLGWYLGKSYYDLLTTIVLEKKIKPLNAEEIKKLPEDVKLRHKIDKFATKLPTVFKYVPEEER